MDLDGVIPAHIGAMQFRCGGGGGFSFFGARWSGIPGVIASNHDVFCHPPH